jgi:IS5 family transposase
MKICRVLLRQAAQQHETGGVAALDATYFDRSLASRHYSDERIIAFRR